MSELTIELVDAQMRRRSEWLDEIDRTNAVIARIGGIPKAPRVVCDAAMDKMLDIRNRLTR